jgi:hypothetical protein
VIAIECLGICRLEFFEQELGLLPELFEDGMRRKLFVARVRIAG